MADARELKEKAGQLFSKGKFAKAAESYEAFCALERKDHQARLRAGDAWSKAGRKDKAAASYAQAAEGFARDGFLPRAIAASKLVLELEPAHKATQKMLAELYAQKSSARPRSSPSGLNAMPMPGPMSAASKHEAIDVPEFEIPIDAVGGPPAFDHAQNEDAIEIEPEPDAPSGPAALTETAIVIELSVGGPVTGEVEIPIEGTPIPDETPSYELELSPALAEADASAAGARALLERAAADRAEAERLAAESSARMAAEREALDRRQRDAEASAAEARAFLARAAADRAAAEKIAAESAAVRAEAERALAAQRAEAEASAAAARAQLEKALADRDAAQKLAAEAAVEREAQIARERAETESRRAEAEAGAAAARAQLERALADRDALVRAQAEARRGDAEKTTVVSPAARDVAADANAQAARAILEKAASTQPPGLKPRRADAPPVSSSPSSSRIWIPPATAASLAPSPSTAASDLERGVEAFTRFDPDVTARTPSAFTELDLDGDTMLHTVVAAAAPFSSSPSVIEELPEEAAPGALPRIPLFSDLPADAFIALFEQCPLLRFEEGQLVFAQGDAADAFFVICAGSARVFRTEGAVRKPLATIEEGSFFGEMALLSDAPRSASVEAAGEDTQVLAISREVLTRLSAAHPSVAKALKKFARQRMLTNLMNNAPLFAPFTRSDRRDLVQKFRARDVGQGDVVLKEGAQSDGLYVVLSGEVEVEIKGARVAVLKEGELFGEMSLLTRSPASATIRAMRHTSLLRLPKSDFDTIILSHPQVLEYVSVLIDERRSSDRTRTTELV